MTWLVMGGTGMVGSALLNTLKSRGIDAVGASRSGSELAVDLRDGASLHELLDRADPSVVVNAAALVDLLGCENNPGEAYAVNAHPVAVMARWCTETGRRLVQVSTDHFWSGDGRQTHHEEAPVHLLNTYAASKFAGETLALSSPDALVLRTNVTGARGDDRRPTFYEWAVTAIEQGVEIPAFDDYYTSTLDTGSFAEALVDLVGADAKGRLNLAASEVSNKLEFIKALAKSMARDVHLKPTSIGDLQITRAESLGLDVSRAQVLLGRRLPTLVAVTARLVNGEKEH